MSDDRDVQDYSLDEFLTARRAMRQGLGLGEERFPLDTFVGMISDEIEAMRAAGRTDAAIAETIATATKRPISAEEIARFYAPPEARHPPG